MSRWADTFRNHPFQTEWTELKNSLMAERVDDPTVITSVEELARLRKIIKYIDELLPTLDPELTPVSSLNNGVSQATYCRSALGNYKGSRDITYLQQANDYADNLLTYFRPYMIAPRSMNRVLQEAFKEYAETINEHAASFSNTAAKIVSEINEYRTESKSLHDQIKQVSSSAGELEAELVGAEVGDDGIKGRVNALVENLKKKESGIDEFYKRLSEKNNETFIIKNEIEQAKASIADDVKASKDILVSVKSKIDDLEQFYIKVYGEAVEEEDKKSGLLADFESRVVALSEFEDKQQKRYCALNSQINSLLPAATSAGLAAAYGDMKDGFNNPIKQMSWEPVRYFVCKVMR